ncbi:MAG: ribonuclease HII [Thermodesulfobacteriota bacterium]
MTQVAENFRFEVELAGRGLTPVAGVDEAGRGPLAGPVVAGAVILPADIDLTPFRDSKKMTAKARERVFELICELAIPHGVGYASPAEIDEINILQASLLAMARAVADLAPLSPGALLVDGKFTIPELQIHQEALIKGEDRSASIAAASIVAKVTRDRLMARLDREYPQYGLARHKGYPTKAHKAAIAEHGPSPIHRLSFKGVREHC